MEDRLQEIIDRVGKTSKGEWHYNNSSCVLTMGQLQDAECGRFKYRVVAPFIQFSMNQIDNDFEFLSHSKKDIEYLIDELKQLRHQDKMNIKPKEEIINEIGKYKGEIEAIKMSLDKEDNELKIQNLYNKEYRLREKINALYWVLGLE